MIPIVELVSGFIAEAIQRDIKPSSVYVDSRTYDGLVKELFKDNPTLLEQHQIGDLILMDIPVYADRNKEADCLYIEIAYSE